MPWMRVLSSKKRSCPAGGWISHPVGRDDPAVAHAGESDRAGGGVAGVRRLEVDRGEVQGHDASVTRAVRGAHGGAPRAVRIPRGRQARTAPTTDHDPIPVPVAGREPVAAEDVDHRLGRVGEPAIGIARQPVASGSTAPIARLA